MNARAITNAPVAADGKGSVGFGLVLRGMRRYALVTFLFVLLAGGAGAAIWFFLPLPKMTAYAIFHIQAHSDAIIKPEGDEKIDFKVYQQTQSALVKSRSMLSNAISQPEVANLPILKKESEPLVWLDNQLKVDFKMGPELMRLSLEGDNADELKAIMDALSAAYLKDVLNKDMARRRARFSTLEKHYRKYEELLEAKRKSYNNLRQSLTTTDPTAQVLREKHIQEEISSLRRELHQLEREELRARGEIALQEKRISQTEQIIVAQELIDSVLRTDLRYQQLLEKKRVIAAGLDELKMRIKPGVEVPSLTRKENELALIGAEIVEYEAKQKLSIVKRLRDDTVLRENHQLLLLKQQVQSTETYRQALEKRRDEFESGIKTERTSQAGFESIKAEIAQTERLAERILSELESMRPELETLGRVRMSESPFVVPGIEGQRRLKYCLMAAFGVLLLGLGLVTALEYRNRRVVHADEVTSGLGLRVIGTVPALPRRALARAASLASGNLPDWHQHLAESVDNTRTLLLYGLDGSQSVRTILVTSALSGEGKTSLAGHLAVSLARAGFKTVLVDGDMRRPSLHRVLGVPLHSGLSEVLRGETTLDRVIQPTPAQGLSVIPAGLWHPRLPQVLAGTAWRDIKTSLETEFDYVIVDTPPLLPVADTLLLARHVDGVLLSLLHDVSRMGAVAAAKDRLAIVGTTILGVVINGVNNDFYGPYYSYCRVPTTTVAAATIA